MERSQCRISILNHFKSLRAPMDTTDKKELLARLSQTGEINRYKKTDTWVDVFNAFQLSTGQPLGFNCGKCYQQALKWLRG